MPVNEFLARFGFIEDPFASTNAEGEERLPEYFVPPPYFAAVLGDPRVPASHVVLAPRGAGKTAQRRMVEIESTSTGRFLCLTYDVFDQPTGFRVADADLAYHLNQVCRILLLGVLARLDDQPDLVKFLTEQQRQLLKYQLSRFLGPLTIDQFEYAVNAIKNLGDKVADFWRKYGGPLGVAIEAILNRLGLQGVQIPAGLVSEARADETLRFHFLGLLDISKRIGYESVYVLVDKVDEIPLTSTDADATFELIRPLLTDLPTLETEGVGFKFFLWDHIGDAYRARGGRPDRVPILELQWSVDELESMLSSRLRAFSEGAVHSFNELQCKETRVDGHLLICHFGAGSPRDVIRVAQSILNEHTRVGTGDPCIEDTTLWAGIRKFCEQRSEELAPRQLGDLRRVGSPTFTINRVANDIFHVSAQSARAKIQGWVNAGVVRQVGELPNPGSRPMHLYGISDIRVATAVLSMSEDLPVILGNYALECSDCAQIVLSAEQTLICPFCGKEFALGEARTLLDVCSL